jgi:hypothetical protein
MTTLNDEQLDELTLRLVVHRSNVKEGTPEHDRVVEALRKIRTQYPQAGHMIDKHVLNMGEQWD